jgi:hypothetical protein
MANDHLWHKKDAVPCVLVAATFLKGPFDRYCAKG